MIVGFCNQPLIEAIQYQQNLHQNYPPQITHYIDATGLDLILAITTIQPLLDSQFYHSYILKHSKVSAEIRALYGCNFLIAEYGDGADCRYLYVLLTGPNSIEVFDGSNHELYRHLTGIYLSNKKSVRSIRKNFPRLVTPMDYVKYTDTMRRLEKNTNIYDVKIDVPIMYIPREILLSVVRESFGQMGFGEENSRNELNQALYDIHILQKTLKQKLRVPTSRLIGCVSADGKRK